MPATYEVRYTPDDWPIISCESLNEAERRAVRHVEKSGCGELLVYQLDEHGERYIGVVS